MLLFVGCFSFVVEKMSSHPMRKKMVHFNHTTLLHRGLEKFCCFTGNIFVSQ